MGQARIFAAKAAQHEMENRKKWIDTRFQMRQLNRMGRAAENGPRPTQEDLVRYARAGKPERLSPSEIPVVIPTAGMTFQPPPNIEGSRPRRTNGPISEKPKTSAQLPQRCLRLR